MNQAEFINQYLCAFQADERMQMLDDKVSEYFSLSYSDASDQVVLIAKKELSNWVYCNGYSNQEFAASKRRCQLRRC